jgi:hypothetical protein
LEDVVDQVKLLLDKITGVWSELLITSDRRKVMREAYDELLDPDVFEQAKLAIADIENSTALSNAGLAPGTKQLEMKLGKGKSLWEKFFTSSKPRWLIRVLGWFNKLLGSLAAAIPIVEVIRELKDACEEEIKDILDAETA